MELLNALHRTRIKFCGLTRHEDVAQAVALGVDALGMVFYPASPRYVTVEQAWELTRALPPFVAVVGLFVNAELDFVRQITDRVPLSMLQFHGDADTDTPEHCQALAQAVGLPWLRALRISAQTSTADLLKWHLDYVGCSADRDKKNGKNGNIGGSAICDGLKRGVLLDTWTYSYGGSGQVFDWSVIPKDFAHCAVLSGGLNAQNVAQAVRQVRPYAVDVSSGIEIAGAAGVKDHAAMAAFVQTVRTADLG